MLSIGCGKQIEARHCRMQSVKSVRISYAASCQLYTPCDICLPSDLKRNSISSAIDVFFAGIFFPFSSTLSSHSLTWANLWCIVITVEITNIRVYSYIILCTHWVHAYVAWTGAFHGQHFLRPYPCPTRTRLDRHDSATEMLPGNARLQAAWNWTDN